MTKFLRVMEFLRIVEEQPHTAAEIAEKLGCSERTVFRYKDEVNKSASGVTVKADGGPGGGSWAGNTRRWWLDMQKEA